MNEILTVVHICKLSTQHYHIKKQLNEHPKLKIIALLNSWDDALIFCSSALPNLIVFQGEHRDESFLEWLEKLIEVCPSSIFVAYGHVPDTFIEVMKVMGVDYFIGKTLSSDMVINLLLFAEQKKAGWD